MSAEDPWDALFGADTGKETEDEDWTMSEEEEEETDFITPGGSSEEVEARVEVLNSIVRPFRRSVLEQEKLGVALGVLLNEQDEEFADWPGALGSGLVRNKIRALLRSSLEATLKKREKAAAGASSESEVYILESWIRCLNAKILRLICKAKPLRNGGCTSFRPERKAGQEMDENTDVDEMTDSFKEKAVPLLHTCK